MRKTISTLFLIGFFCLSEFVNSQNWTIYNTSNSGISSNDNWFVNFDVNNNAWISTTNAGIVKYNDTTWVSFNTSNSNIPYNYICASLFDKSGNLWIGTNGGE